MRVVLVHGIWMSGLDLLPLAGRLEKEGFSARIFRYPSLRASPADNARALQAFVHDLGPGPTHLVGHSLGGLVILRALEEAGALPSGRVVLMGSPVKGSAVAALLAAHPLLRPLVLGRSVEEGLLGERVPGCHGREVMVLAGSKPVGLGRLIRRLPPPHDGTVAVEETRLDGAAAHHVLPVNHTGFLLSKDVAARIAAFLKEGTG